MKQNTKGFTLVEVILCIALLMVVITPIGYMLINQTKSTKDNQAKSIVQQNAQSAMAAFRTKCLPASFVTSVEDSGGISAMSESTADLEFSKLTIKNKYTNEITTYKYDSSIKTLTYNNSAVIDGLKIYLSPLPDTADYSNCKGLKVKIISEKPTPETGKTHKVELENQFYFRNSN